VNESLKRVCVAAFLVFGSALVGCQHGPDKGLNKVMLDYHFTPIAPPQTGWEVGSVVQVERAFPSAPVLFNTPKLAGVKAADMPTITRVAPDVERNYESKTELGAGITLPAKIAADLAVQGATQYSVAAGDNYIVVIPLDNYARNAFPKLAAQKTNQWTLAMGKNELAYLNEVWFAKSLEYKFYNSGGAQVKLTSPTDLTSIKWSASADFSWKDDGSLVYHGSEPICLGYKSRAVRAAENGEVVVMSAGSPTAAPKEARSAIQATTQP
jgi:hypothetical protein